MAKGGDSIDLALEELENEPLPTQTRDRSRQEDEIQVDYAEDGDESAPAGRETDGNAPETREIEPQEGIDELRARLQASDAARRQAEDRANTAEQARAQATGATQDANVQMLSTALDSVRQQLGALEANLAEAYSVQDFATAAKIQTELAKTAQRESIIENGLEQLKAAPREQPRAPPAPLDEVEAVARTLTPNAAAWVRAHPTYVTDQRLNNKLVAAHWNAMGDGLVADSPEYIAYVEDKLGISRSATERTPVPETRRAAPPAAPPSRGANGGANPARVTLTREQRESAHENFPDEMAQDPTGRKAEQAYARNMLILRREGRMN